MTETDRLTEIGKFQRTHGLQGELNAVIDYDPELLLDYPLFVYMDGLPVPFFAESVRPKGATTALVKLEGIDDIDQAAGFVNKTIMMEPESLKDFYGEDFEEDEDIVGMILCDSLKGEIGVIEHLDLSTDNPLLIVAMADGTEVYVPFAEDWIVDVNHEMNNVTMRLPDGLLDINTVSSDDIDDRD